MKLTDLYQELIMDHSRHPKHRGELEQPTHQMDGDNPLCGDQLTLHLNIKDDRIEDACFNGQGCAISTAATSMMLERCMGQSLEYFNNVFALYHRQLTGDALSDAEKEKLGKLASFAGVATFPMRVKCATLCWHTMDAAIKGSDDFVSTE